MNALSGPERIMVECLEQGRSPSLEELGGIDTLTPLTDQLRQSPLVGEFVKVVVAEAILHAPVSNSASTFVSGLIDGASDEFALSEIVDTLEGANWVDETCAQACFDAFRHLLADRTASAIARALALDGAFRIGLTRPALRYELFSSLLRVEPSDDPTFLSRALKVLGVAYASDRTPALLDQIVALGEVEAVRGEAAYEIGLAKLANAFDAKGIRDAQLTFGDSAYWFRKADESTQVSPEAKLYATCLEILSKFSATSDAALLTSLAGTIHRCSISLAAWHYDEADPGWLGSRKLQTACWESLAYALRDSAEAASSELWLEPVVTIEQHILPIYVASRSVFRRTTEGGLEEVLRPRIEAALSTERVRCLALQHWLRTNVEHEWREAADELGKRALVLVVETIDSRPTKATTVEPGVVALVNGSTIPDEAKRRVIQAIEDSTSLQFANLKAAEVEVFDRCTSEVAEDADYKGQADAKMLFNTILLWSIRFLSARLDMTVQNDRSLSYLFYNGIGKRPLEGDLQQDYYRVMHLNGLGASVEISDVGGGRADVLFRTGADHMVCEVKREEKDASFANLRATYLEQSVAYQATSYRLGFMLVLDQTEAGAGMTTHLTDLIRVETYVRKGESHPRRSVVLKVPGRKSRPSGLTKAAQKGTS